MTEITFIAQESEDGGYYARAAEAALFTQADTLEELRLMIKDVIECHFEVDKPELIYLQLR